MTTRRPPHVLSFIVNGFNGGLNLRRDQFQLANDESPDLLNVDIDPRGGFRLRGGTTVMNSTALAVEPSVLGVYNGSGNTLQVIATYINGAASRMYYSTLGNFTQFGIDYTATVPCRFAVMNDLAYLNRWTDTFPIRWNQAATTNLTASGAPTWQEDYGAPTGGFMPSAKTICAHAAFMWVGGTSENGAGFPHRVRWSHPGRPEDWRSADYIDVGLHDGDYITALASWNDRLLVFKNRSVWEITGYSSSSFSARKLWERGAVSQEAVVVGDLGVFWFSQSDGAFWYDGARVHWIFEPLKPAIEDGNIPQAYMSTVRLGWGNRRLWVSVPYGASATNRTRSFVWDPTLGKEGAWTAYDLKTGPYTEYVLPGASGNKVFLGAQAGSGKVLKLDQSVATDDLGSGAVAISSYYVTRWYDAGNGAIVKRWKRPLIVSRGGQTGTITVVVFRDYNYGAQIKAFNIENVLPGGWGTSVWDGFLWSDGSGYDEIDKGASFGRAKAVSLKFTGPTQTVKWGIDSIIFKFLPKPLR